MFVKIRKINYYIEGFLNKCSLKQIQVYTSIPERIIMPKKLFHLLKSQRFFSDEHKRNV